MSANQPQETGTSQTSPQALPGNAPGNNPQNHEHTLVNLYKEITQEDESQARSTFMFVTRETEESSPTTPN